MVAGARHGLLHEHGEVFPEFLARRPVVDARLVLLHELARTRDEPDGELGRADVDGECVVHVFRVSVSRVSVVVRRSLVWQLPSTRTVYRDRTGAARRTGASSYGKVFRAPASP